MYTRPYFQIFHYLFQKPIFFQKLMNFSLKNHWNLDTSLITDFRPKLYFGKNELCSILTWITLFFSRVFSWVWKHFSLQSINQDPRVVQMDHSWKNISLLWKLISHWKRFYHKEKEHFFKKGKTIEWKGKKNYHSAHCVIYQLLAY